MKFNDVESVESYVTGLKTLHEVINYRRTTENKPFLKRFSVLRDSIMFDECGNVWVKDNDSSTSSHSYFLSPIPKKEDVCPFCGKPFNIYKLSSCLYIDGLYYHNNCHFLKQLNNGINELKDMFNSIYDKEWNYQIISNEYNTDGLPWFLVTTPDGDIKIGYRKRVIHIEWMNNYKPFTETFENESVTKCFQAQEVQRFIHAWTLDKAMEYLRKAKEMINNEYC